MATPSQVMLAPMRPPPEFRIDSEQVGLAFQNWLKSYDIYELACGLSGEHVQDSVKRATFLHLLGPEVQRIFFTLPGENKTYDEARRALETYFKPKTKPAVAQFRFSERCQRPGESIDQWLVALRELASHCAFPNEDQAIAHHITQKCYSSKLRDKLLDLDPNPLPKVLEVARNFEVLSRDRAELAHEKNEVNRVSYSKPRRPPNKEKFVKTKATKETFSECFRCGKHDHSSQDCGAIRMICNACHTKGHLARKCPSRKETHAKRVEESETAYRVDATDTETVRINGTNVDMIIDTGATRNFLPVSIARQVMNKNQELKETPKKFFAYGQSKPLDCRGYFRAVLTYGNSSIDDDVFVINGNVEPLLSGTASFRLGILQRNTAYIIDEKSDIFDRNSHLFEGIGFINSFSHKLTINESVPPVAQKLRRFPLCLRQAIDDQLDEMLNRGIIEEVKTGNTWVSNLVIVTKPSEPTEVLDDFAELPSTDEIRLCVDFRDVNKAVIRQRHPLPKIDDLLQQLNGAKVFAHLDLKRGFWQVELHPESRPYTCFITHRGCFQFVRVPFGLNSAPEAFQSAMDKILAGCQNTVWYMDDVYVHAKTPDELDSFVQKVLDRFSHFGIRLNRAKCQFGLQEIEVLGHLVSSEGIKASPKKVDAILDASSPENPQQVQSFLGSCGFLRKFIPNFAAVTEPLRKLTHKDEQWSWNAKEQQAFESIKRSLCSTQVLIPFDPQVRTVLMTDASPAGLGAVLMQGNDDALRPVAYASKSLTGPETRYSQIERELLGIAWACEHFYEYLWGQRFLIRTDQQALVKLLGTSKSTFPTPRFERLSWRVFQFDFEITHVKGKENYADFLSRHPQKPTSGNGVENLYCIAEEHVRNVIQLVTTETALTLQEIKRHSSNDVLIRELRENILSEKWSSTTSEGKHFFKMKDELSCYGDLVLRQDRIVLPEALREKALKLAHENHPGMTRTKQTLREKYYWPGLDSDVERIVSQCSICQQTQPLVRDEPLNPIERPRGPWQKVGIDIVGPIDGTYLLTMIDYFSNFPEVFMMETISSAAVISRLNEVFCRYGFPDSIITDNGRQFVSEEFEQFLRECGIGHVKASAYYPKTNGKIERFHRFLKQKLLSVKLEHKSWKKMLPSILQDYRSTISRATGSSPHDLFFGRKMRTKLNHFETREEVENTYVHNYQQKMKLYTDRKRGARKNNLSVGDYVLVANMTKSEKFSPTYLGDTHQVIARHGGAFKVRNLNTGAVLTRNPKHLRRTRPPTSTITRNVPAQSEASSVSHLNDFDYTDLGVVLVYPQGFTSEDVSASSEGESSESDRDLVQELLQTSTHSDGVLNNMDRSNDGDGDRDGDDETALDDETAVDDASNFERVSRYGRRLKPVKRLSL